MRSTDTEFVGGPLDGRVLPIMVSLFNAVPKVYPVPVPAHGDEPARTLLYDRVKVHDAKGRAGYRYEYRDA
jgi:hypothetical protein